MGLALLNRHFEDARAADGPMENYKPGPRRILGERIFAINFRDGRSDRPFRWNFQFRHEIGRALFPETLAK